MNEQLNAGCKRRTKVKIRVKRYAVDYKHYWCKGEVGLVTTNLLGSVFWWDSTRDNIGYSARRRMKCESWEMWVCMHVTLLGVLTRLWKKKIRKTRAIILLCRINKWAEGYAGMLLRKNRNVYGWGNNNNLSGFLKKKKILRRLESFNRWCPFNVI